jgi:phosphatidate cytidylyltransferase
LSIVGSLELGRLMRMCGLNPQVGWAVFCGAAITVSPWLVSGLLLNWNSADLLGYQWILALVAFALVGTVVGALRRRERMTGAIADLGATWTVILYTGLLPCFALQLRSHSLLHGAGGAWLILIFILVVKVSDIGAWATGLLIGRHPLIPWISPKKTIEGSVGGIVLSMALALLLWQAHHWTEAGMAPATAPSGGSVEAQGAEIIDLGDRSCALIHEMTRNFAGGLRSWWQPVVFGLLMSIFGQLGDLIESSFKRAADAKDSAAVLPAFGGILDIIDSPLLAAPVAWFLLTCWWSVA